MPLPPGPERLYFTSDARPLPVPLSPGKVELGYIGEPIEESLPVGGFPDGGKVQPTTFEYLPVTHGLVDRTFAYRVLLSIKYAGQPDGSDRKVVYDDVRALFIPNNDIRPSLDDGDWYFGRDKVVNYLETNGAVFGILFAAKGATVRWTGEGADCAQDLQNIMRPQLSPRDATPFDFRGIYDCGCPDTCDM